MSLAEKFVSLMARPGHENQPPSQQDDHPWYLKYGARVAGIIGAFFGIIFGLWNCVGIITGNVSCLVFGIFQVMGSMVVMVIEAPCCCVVIDHVQKVAMVADNRPLWQRAVLYCSIALIPVIFCFSLASLFPGIILFGTGFLYGMMGLGKKASREQMGSAAMASDNSRPISTTGKRLVDNAQPIAFTGPPAFDSNI